MLAIANFIYKTIRQRELRSLYNQAAFELQAVNVIVLITILYSLLSPAAVNAPHYGRPATALLLVLALVLIMDGLSAWLRQHFLLTS